MDQLGEETEVKQLTGDDRTLVSGRPTRVVSWREGGATLVIDRTLALGSDLTHRGRVQSSMTYANVMARGVVVRRGR